MATSQANPETKSEKQKYPLVVDYEAADGSWKTASSEREFSAPDEDGEITVKGTADDGKTQVEVKRKFRKNGLVAKSPQDVLRLLETNPLLVVSAYNYGVDLFARVTIKGPIGTEIEGPGKAIAKMAEQIFTSRAKLGKPISKERALALAQAMAEADAEQ